MKTRDLSIDYLRFLGISMIILAHASCPFILSQIRCFDVPLMIFISGLTASRKKYPSFTKYVWERSKRLIIPVYIFLTAYFFVSFIFYSMGVSSIWFSLKDIVHSYLLLGGIGYVWIIRVFLLIMIVTPLLVRFEMYCKKRFIYGLLCVVLLFVNDMLLTMSYPIPGGKLVNLLFGEFVIYLLGYIPVFMLGLSLRYANNKYRWISAACAILCLLVTLWFYIVQNGLPIIISPQYKYPPQAYYIIYSLVASLLLWNFKDVFHRIIFMMRLSIIAKFVGQNTIWIYLWHIPFVHFAVSFIDNWFLRYVFIYVMSLLFFSLQNRVVKKIGNDFATKYLIG